MLTRGAFDAAARARAPHDRLRAGVPVLARRRADVAGGADRAARSDGGAVRHRPRHPPRRHDPRHQGARRVRGAGGRGAAHRAPRAREAGADRAAGRASRTSSPRSTAIWSTRASTSTRSAATSRRLPAPRRSGSPARCTSCCAAGAAFVEGVESPFSLMAASKGVYGEAAGEWTAAEAHGFSRMLALPGIFYTRAGQR